MTLRERRFARAGRAGKDDGRQTIGFDRAPQKFARREDVFLPDKLLERARPHSCGERCRGERFARPLPFLRSRTNRARRKILWERRLSACTCLLFLPDSRLLILP